jgi:hypothetical protein
MAIPQQYVDRSREQLSTINTWFEQAVASNPSAVLSLVAQRGSRVEQEIYASFRNDRRGDYERERDVNTLKLSCHAGRARPFDSVPKDSSSGVVERDGSYWTNVPEENRVDVHNNIAGNHGVEVAADRSRVTFTVSCRGVSAEDTSRGHGAYDATLHASFRYTPDAISTLINVEVLELGNIIGV